MVLENQIDQLTDLHAKEVMCHACSYRKYTSPNCKSLDSVAIANKENAKSPSDHSTTEPNASYQTWPSKRPYLNDRGVDHRCLLYHESIKSHCAICMASYCEMKYRKKLSEGTV